jgi:hypothetical protein
MNLLCKTAGCRIGEVRLPRFEVNRCEWIVLRWPINFGGEPERKFYSVLCGEPHPEFSLYARAQIATLIGLGESSAEPEQSVGDLLAALPSKDADVLLPEIRQAGLSFDSPLNHLPKTPRCLAGVIRAASEAELVAFNTSGLDPIGVQKVFSLVLGKLRQGRGFLELEFPGIGQKHPRPIDVTTLDATLAGK